MRLTYSSHTGCDQSVKTEQPRHTSY